VDAALGLSISIWATDPRLADALLATLAEPGRDLRLLENDGQLAASGSGAGLLVAQAGPRLDAQQTFLRGPFILVDPQRISSSHLARRAYAIVPNPAEANLAVDRFIIHRHAAAQAAGARGAPSRCSRCGRGFDAQKARRGGTATRFVRFGSVALCGGCVDQLRTLLRQAESAVVEADA
jgi:hypothetical protein